MSAGLRTTLATQPTYLPWLGYFEQIARADTVVFLDIVQFERRSWQSRNKLKGPNGEPFWLTVPVENAPREAALKDIRISRERPDWARKHLASIRSSLGRTAHFEAVYPLVEEWLLRDYDFLVDLNVDGILLIAGLLGLAPRFARASELPVSGRRTELLRACCLAVGTDVYLSAAGAKAYLDAERTLLEEAGMTIRYQDWTPPEYPQAGPGFVPYLSALDALMNIGPEPTRQLIVGEQRDA